MSKKQKKHKYAERLKYMHMLEKGYSIKYISKHYGINEKLLGYLWARYQAEGPSALIKKANIKADYKFKVKVVRDIVTLRANTPCNSCSFGRTLRKQYCYNYNY